MKYNKIKRIIKAAKYNGLVCGWDLNKSVNKKVLMHEQLLSSVYLRAYTTIGNVIVLKTRLMFHISTKKTQLTTEMFSNIISISIEYYNDLGEKNIKRFIRQHYYSTYVKSQTKAYATIKLPFIKPISDIIMDYLGINDYLNNKMSDPYKYAYCTNNYLLLSILLFYNSMLINRCYLIKGTYIIENAINHPACMSKGFKFSRDFDELVKKIMLKDY